jgi:hypothetical protein
MNKLKLAYIVLIISLVLLFINTYRLLFLKIDNGNLLGLISNICLFIAMVISIRDLKKIKEK